MGYVGSVLFNYLIFMKILSAVVGRVREMRFGLGRGCYFLKRAEPRDLILRPADSDGVPPAAPCRHRVHRNGNSPTRNPENGV